MNKKPLDTLLSHQNYNDSLFKQSISLVQSTKTITPITQIPLELMKSKQSLQLKKKQQLLETHLAKTIKLFGQVLGTRKTSYGTVGDFAVEVFDELTDLIEAECGAFVEKKKNIKAIEKQKEKNTQNVVSSNANNNSNRPQDRFPFIHPCHFDHHSHAQPPLSKLLTTPPTNPTPSQPLSDPFTYINTLQGLQKMILQLSVCKQIAVDLQHSPKSYQGFTSLIQISSRHKDYIIDVFPIWQHIPLLKEIISNQNIIKVMHGAQMDTKWLQRDFNIHIVNLFDTYKASRVLGYPKFSYAYLLHHYCNVAIDKKYQLADWRQRPLSQQMLQYARMDTHYLLQIWDKLLIDLTKQSQAMNLQPESTIAQIYKSSHLVTCSQVQLFSYKKRQLYQNIKNDTKPQDFQIIQTVFWTIDKISKQQDQCFDQLINRRTLTDVIGRVKDLIQNKRATIDMLRVKIDRLIGVVKSHKHEKVGLLLAPLKKELEKYFLEPKKEVETGKKKLVVGKNDTQLIELIHQQQKKQNTKENINNSITSSTSQQVFRFQKPSITIEQLDYPLKTYQNFSLQQRLNNKKSAFSLIQFQPIMLFLSQKYNVQQKQTIQQQNPQQEDASQSSSMQVQGEQNAQNQQKQVQNEGFLEFKRIKPNVIYTIEEQVEEEKDVQKNPRKKRKELEYEQKLKNKDGNIYDLLEDV